MTMKEEKIKIYATLPSKLFTKKNKKDNVICGDIKINEKEYDDRIVSIMCYLSINKNIKNICGTSIEKIIRFCDMKPNRAKGQTNDKFRQSLIYLVKKGYFVTDVPIEKVKLKENIEFTLPIINDNFSMLYEEDLINIINYCKSNKTSSTKLLTFFAYINQGMHKPENHSCGNSQARVYYPSYSTISKRTGTKDNTITKYIDILQNELKIITVFNAGRYVLLNKKDDKSFKLPNIYTLNRNGNNDDEFRAWKRDFKQQFPDRKIVRDFTSKEKKFYGKKGSLIKKEMDGVITNKERNQLNKIIAIEKEMVKDRNLSAEEKYNQEER